MTQKYIALIGDLIASKDINDRSKTQNQVSAAFNHLNETYSEIIVSNLTITLGDEFQAVLKVSPKLFEFIDHLHKDIPHPVRFGIGLGEITTEINPKASIGADGPAYWHAREAIDNLKENNWQKVLKHSFIGSETMDETINSLLLLTDSIRSNWTEKQKNTFNDLLNLGIYQPTFNQKQAAAELNLSESAFSKRLSAGQIKIYFQGKQTLSNIVGGLAHD